MYVRIAFLIFALALPTGLLGQWQSVQPASGELPAERIARMQLRLFKAAADKRAKAPLIDPAPHLLPPISEGGFLKLSKAEQEVMLHLESFSEYVATGADNWQGARTRYQQLMQEAETTSSGEYIKQVATALYLTVLVAHPNSPNPNVESCVMHLYLTGYREAGLMARALQRLWGKRKEMQPQWEEIRKHYLTQAAKNIMAVEARRKKGLNNDPAATLSLSAALKEGQKIMALSENIYQDRYIKSQKTSIEILTHIDK